jgi:hypothetical protein
MEYVMKKRRYICMAKLCNIQACLEYLIKYQLYNAILILYYLHLNGLVALYQVFATTLAADSPNQMPFPVPLVSGFNDTSGRRQPNGRRSPNGKSEGGGRQCRRTVRKRALVDGQGLPSVPFNASYAQNC